MTTELVRLTLEARGMDRDPDGWRHHAYRATLHYRGRQLTTPYRTGEGWTEDPTAADVLGCLLMDAAGYDNAQDLEDWAGDYGWDLEDPEKRTSAEKTYRQVARQTEKLRRLLGEDYDAAVFPPDLEDSEQVAARLTGEETPSV